MALYFLDKARTAARLCVNVTLLLGIVGWSLISLSYSAEIYDIMWNVYQIETEEG